MFKHASGSLIYSPSDLTTYIESPFASWMDRYRAEGIEPAFEKDPDDAGAILISDRGNVHEELVLKRIESEYGPITRIERGKTFSETEARTFEAMKAGARVIYQAALRLDPFQGYADFLIRKELPEGNPSKLGAYYYEAWDSKLAHSVKPYFITQLLCYTEMLTAIQGIRPEEFRLCLGNGTDQILRTVDFFDQFQVTKSAFLSFQQAFDRQNPPVPEKGEKIRNWSNEAEKRLIELDHLSQVANIRRAQIAKLEQANIKTLAKLANHPEDRIGKMEDSTFRKLKKQAELQLRSRGKDRPDFEVKPHEPGSRIGLARLPDPSPGDIYFDMEGYPLYDEKGLEYLFGLIHHQSGQEDEFRVFWAHSREEEKAAFEGFIDLVMERWKSHPDLHIYHYAAYEVTAARKLSTRHRTREEEVDRILRANLFVDLYAVVSQCLVVGESSYSIKYIEHLYMEKRSGGVTNAGDSMVQYAAYLAAPDGPTEKESKVLESIWSYNRDDCVSTVKLTQWLRGVKSRAGIDYIDPGSETDAESDSKPESERGKKKKERREKLREHANRLTSDFPPESTERIVGDLLEFHGREEKQYWWRYFERLSMTPEELYDENECLAQLRLVGSPTEVKNSLECEYEFDPEQITKIDQDTDVQIIIDGIQVGTGKIGSIDLKGGKLSLRISKNQIRAKFNGAFPNSPCLIPSPMSKNDPLEEALLRMAEKTAHPSGAGQLPPPVLDLLEKRRPRFHPVLEPDGRSLAIEDIPSLDGALLCVQGPPGAGKTYNGAQVILKLLDQNRKIGIMSNSHKAIENLMLAVKGMGKIPDGDPRLVKVGGDKDSVTEHGLVFAKSDRVAQLVEEAQHGIIIGGTAWTFVSEELESELHTLFVDEAGQVSLANLLAVSGTASNLVLLGDQAQLEQPIQGSHPGKSGESALSYFLEGHNTVPPELGVFLDKSRRMRPEICDYISKHFYEGRLQSHESSVKRSLHNPNPEGLVRKSRGLIFIPVETGHHTKYNPDEIDMIVKLVRELKTFEFEDNTCVPPVKRTMQNEDILVVAPYNVQVNRLQAALGGIRVGTIDRFQGQEAPVVILSMTASSLDDAPRGVEFLLNPNRLNVALSRAQCLAIVVGNPALQSTSVNSVEKMRMLNLFCAIVAEGTK